MLRLMSTRYVQPSTITLSVAAMCVGLEQVRV